MPDDKKAPTKPRYKVEEVESDTPEVTPQEDKKITSFSTLDTTLPEKHTETHVAEKEEPVEEKETEMSEPKEETHMSIAHHTVETEPVEMPEEEVAEVGNVEPEENDEIKKWLENVPSTDSTHAKVSSGGGAGKFIALFLGILIIAALGGGIYYYRANVEQSPTADNPTKEETAATTPETSQETVSPTPTAAAMDLSKYKVQILNGGGVPGEAGKAQGYLESAGFKDFKTGNASAFTYTDTEVSMKKDTPDDVFAKVKETLEKQYQGVVKSEKILPDSSDFDLQITIGKKK